MSSLRQLQKTCEYCASSFIAKTFTTRYCSKQCNNNHYKKLQRDGKEGVVSTRVPSIFDSGKALQNVSQEYYEVNDACSLLHVSRRTLYRLIASRKLKKKKIMSRTVILKEDIRIFFAHQ